MDLMVLTNVKFGNIRNNITQWVQFKKKIYKIKNKLNIVYKATNQVNSKSINKIKNKINDNNFYFKAQISKYPEQYKHRE